MNELSIKQSFQAAVAKGALSRLEENPQEGFSRLLSWADKIDVGNRFLAQRNRLREATTDPNNNWNRLVRSFWTDIDAQVRKVFLENFFVNSVLIGTKRQEKLKAEHNCNIPWAILLNLTSACNLACTGCWAAKYGGSLSLDYSVLDGVVRQGKEMGVYLYLFTGGEPLVRRNDIIRLCCAHSDCVFVAFTNGTLIDQSFAAQMLRTRNFVPAISVEGFEEATDSRRGKGVFQKVMDAMRILRENKLLFGVSCYYTSRNIPSLASEEYMDILVDNGVKFAWFFHYMPVGNSAVPDLLPSPEERLEMYRKIREYRNTKPVFTIDFQNDAEYIGGCVAGGRRYLHINANGDVEPCAFVHYADSNIRTSTLLEACKSPLFMAYKERQPFNGNMLRPCPMLENPEALRRMVRLSGAHSTDVVSPESVDGLCAKCKPYADKWAVAADKLLGEKRACGEYGPKEKS